MDGVDGAERMTAASTCLTRRRAGPSQRKTQNCARFPRPSRNLLTARSPARLFPYVVPVFSNRLARVRAYVSELAARVHSSDRSTKKATGRKNSRGRDVAVDNLGPW
jgi:hypothetical protein